MKKIFIISIILLSLSSSVIHATDYLLFSKSPRTGEHPLGCTPDTNDKEYSDIVCVIDNILCEKLGSTSSLWKCTPQGRKKIAAITLSCSESGKCTAKYRPYPKYEPDVWAFLWITYLIIAIGLVLFSTKTEGNICGFVMIILFILHSIAEQLDSYAVPNHVFASMT